MGLKKSSIFDDPSQLFLIMTYRRLILFSLVCALFVSCNKDDENDRNQFLGRYEVEEYSHRMLGHREDYEVRIDRDPQWENRVIVHNFYNLGLEVYAEVDGRTLIVPVQVHNFFEVEGEGSLSGSEITLYYTIRSVLESSEFCDDLAARMKLIE